MYANNISVPHSYFKKAKKEYRDWLSALFREIIQNSVDAGATNIDFKLDEYEDSFLLNCIDNGSGMDESILVNVLLCLGGSHKTNPDAIGGFGYAKTLLFFAHDHYQIKSKDNIVNGIGGNYELTKTNDFIDGTEINIKISKIHENEKIFNDQFEDAVNDIMAYSNLKKTTITFNGNKVRDNIYNFNYKYPTTIGKVIFKDVLNSYCSKLWVRINGLAMFQHNVWSDNKSCFLGILELNQDPIKVLTSNRDSLKGQAEIEFNKIFTSLQDERSSLKNNKIMNWTLNETQIILENSEDEEKTFNQHSDSKNTSERVRNSNSQSENQSNNEPDPFKNPPQKAQFSPFEKLIEANEKEYSKIDKLIGDLDEYAMPINFKIQKDGSCSLKNYQIKNELSKKNNIKLAHRWNKVVYSILSTMPDLDFYDTTGYKTDYTGQSGLFFHYSRPVNVGFIFGDDAKAVNSSNNKTINIMLNPNLVKFNTKISKLYDIGFHEITHIYTSNHDENFSSIEMKIKWEFRDYLNVLEIKKFGKVSF